MTKLLPLIGVIVALALSIGTVQAGDDYRIVSDTAMQAVKRSVEVELAAPVPEARLGEIAREIKAMDRRPFERTFIGYRLRGEAAGLPYLYTTHFNPELKVVDMTAFRPNN